MKQEMTSNFTILNSLFQKLQHEETGQYFCSYQEVMGWPKGVLAHLIKVGFLIEANQAKGLICPECYRGCYKEIERESNGSLFVYCHEPDEINSYIPIDAVALQQWAVSEKTIANFIASFFDKAHKDKPALWADVGMSVFIKGKPAHIKLVWERQLCFQVNKETPHPLTNLLVWDEGKEGFGLNMKAIEALGETAISKHNPVKEDDLEAGCGEWIAKKKEFPIPVKKKLWEEAEALFLGIKERAFNRAWKKEAPTSWTKAGPKKQSNHRTK